MRLRFLGAARSVTGSCHMLDLGGKKVLLDCGLRQGKRKESFEKNRNFDFDPASIDAVVLSHAHIDHSGNLPRLVAAGFNGPIYATKATRDLCDWMLRDSAYIQEKDVQYVNRKRHKKGQRPFEPLYTIKDAEETMTRFKGLAYGKDTELFPGLGLRFEDAGHILGSASCHLSIAEGDQTLVFTGDIGRTNRPILRDPVPPKKADILISESTYGDRLHEDEESVMHGLHEILHETFDRGGRLVIPAFSVGRTQRLVYDLHTLFDQGKLPPVPIFVDSPLAVNITNVFRAHPECFDDEAMRHIDNNRDPLGFSRVTYVRDVEASKALNELRVPCVIISASGMCEAGRVLHHLKKAAPHPENTILVVGFMAEHTLGRRIVERAPKIKIFGDEFPLEARVETIGGLSAHADRNEILAHFRELEAPPRRTFLVHGEPTPAEALAVALRDELGFPEVNVPAQGEKFEV